MVENNYANKMRYHTYVIIDNLRVDFNTLQYNEKSCVKFASNREVATKRKPRNHCGFWVFEVLDEK